MRHWHTGWTSPQVNSRPKIYKVISHLSANQKRHFVKRYITIFNQVSCFFQFLCRLSCFHTQLLYCSPSKLYSHTQKYLLISFKSILSFCFQINRLFSSWTFLLTLRLLSWVHGLSLLTQSAVKRPCHKSSQWSARYGIDVTAFCRCGNFTSQHPL